MGIKLRKYKEEQTKGIFSLLVRTNLARIVWGLIILGLLFGILFAIFMPLANMPYFTLYMVRNRLIHEEFDRIDNFGITDGKGSFEIVNSEFMVIYPENVEKSYTKEEIDAVWEIDYLRTKAKQNQYILNGELYTQIICDGNKMYDGWFLLVDESLRYVDSANFPTIKEKYANSDIKYFLEDMIFDRGMYKYEFITSKGQTYNMLIKYGSPAVLLDDNEIDILIYTAGGLVAIFILFIILSINSVSRKFKKPIKQLDEAMEGFSNGNYSDINLNHRGVREIATVINTFNDMVKKLQESEDENKRLSNEKQRLIADISHDLKTPITIKQHQAEATFVSPRQQQQLYNK